MLTINMAENPTEPVIQFGRMPFGLIEYIKQFFTTPNVRQALVNVPSYSHTTQVNIDKDLPYDGTSNVQEEATLNLKEAKPDRRFWLKLDGTDVKTAQMESVRGVWNGEWEMRRVYPKWHDRGRAVRPVRKTPIPGGDERMV